MKSKISIITVCFNAEKEIEKTIQSVLEQSYNNIEYIIIDGASTDNTLNIINKYKTEIDIVISEKDNGIFDAFNKGIRLASGDVIHILNAGDYYSKKDVVEYVMNHFEDNSIDFVHGEIETVDVITNEREIYHFPINIPIEEAILDRNCPPHPAFFVKKDCIDQFGEFNDSYKIAADTELMFNCFLYKKGTFIDYVTTVFVKDGISSDPYFDKVRLNEVDEIITKVMSLQKPLLSNFDDNKNTLDFVKIWNKFNLAKNQGITSIYKNKNLRVVIFGTKDVAQMLYFDCIKESHEVVCFIDNGTSKTHCLGKEINKTEWLIKEQENYDLCITSIEGQHEFQIIETLKYLVGSNKIISWKEIISNITRNKQ